MEIVTHTDDRAEQRFGPAFPSDAAFFLRFMLPVGSITDEDGRPLHEVDFRSSIPANEYSAARFQDSRAGYLINMVAFRQMASVWKDILMLGKYFGNVTQEASGNPLARINHLWRASLAAMFFPVYTTERLSSPFYHKPLSVPVAALFKVALDLPTTLDLLLVSGTVASLKRGSTEEIVCSVTEFADSERILLNGDYACAGPQKLMGELIRALLDDNSRLEAPQFGLDDPDSYREFCALMTAQYVVGYWFGIASGLLSEERYRLSGQRDLGPLHQHPSAYERRRRFALSRLLSGSQRQAAYVCFMEAMDPFFTEQRQLVFHYFRRLEVILSSDLAPAKFFKNQREIELETEAVIRACQTRISDGFGIQFSQDVGLASFWDNLPRNWDL